MTSLLATSLQRKLIPETHFFAGSLDFWTVDYLFDALDVCGEFIRSLKI
jgi:hypothetical protein